MVVSINGKNKEDKGIAKVYENHIMDTKYTIKDYTSGYFMGYKAEFID